MSAIKTIPVAKPNFRSCTKCGRVGHTETTCEFPERAINMIGCEIEGYWYDLLALNARCRTIQATLTDDGSLGGYASCENAMRWRQFNDGRLAIRPTLGEDHDPMSCDVCHASGREVRSHPGSLGHMCNQIALLYPDVVSGKASLHVHVSFLDPMSISLIACKAFHVAFRESITEFCDARKFPSDHWLRKRIRGEASDPDARPHGQSSRGGFCMQETHVGEFPATLIVNGRDSNGQVLQDGRYHMINYHAWADHGTIEFRVGSAFADPADAIAYVQHLHDMIEAWIARKGTEVIASSLGHVAQPTTDGKVTIEIGAWPDVPTLQRHTVEIGSPDLEIPRVREGAILATIQTAHRRIGAVAEEAVSREIVIDDWTGTARFRADRPHRRGR